jgi:hypothetical protein
MQRSKTPTTSSLVNSFSPAVDEARAQDCAQQQQRHKRDFFLFLPFP